MPLPLPPFFAKKCKGVVYIAHSADGNVIIFPAPSVV